MRIIWIAAVFVAACTAPVPAPPAQTTVDPTPSTVTSAPAIAPEIVAERERQRSAYASLIATGGRYMEHGCGAPRLDFAGYETMPVVTCDYESLGVHARVSMLNPSAEQLAAWTVSACADIHAADLAACGDTVRAQIWGESNAQFPVAGFVIEPPSGIGVTGVPANTPYCILFRDGVSATTASFATHAYQVGETCGPDSANAEPLRSALRFARVASTNRAMYKAAGGVEDVDAGGATPFSPHWANVAGKLWREAWTSDRNFLIYAWALDAKARDAVH